MKRNFWVLVFVLSSVSLRAEIGISNLGDTADAEGGVNNYGTPFTVGPSSGDLTNITIVIFNYTGTADTIGLSLYSDAAGDPGTLLESLGSESTTDAAANRYATIDLSFSLSTPVALDPNTTYWLLGSGGNNENWYATESGATGLSGWSIGATKINISGTWYSIGESYQMSLEVSPVPEPSAWALFSLGVAGFTWRGFRRQNRV